MNAIRVLIADDHPLYRQGVQTALSNASDIDVIGEAKSGEEAVTMASSLRPDLILMDIQMPGLNGIDATRKISSLCPSIYILVITMFEDDQYVFSAIQAGARGYILKDAERDDILRAIRAVGRGEIIFSSGIASRMVEFFSNARLTTSRELFPDLTIRESEVLFLISKGASNHEVASSLGLTSKTVSNYIANILNKLQVTDREEAARRVRDMK